MASTSAFVIGFPVGEPAAVDDVGAVDDPAVGVAPAALACPKMADTILPKMLMRRLLGVKLPLKGILPTQYGLTVTVLRPPNKQNRKLTIQGSLSQRAVLDWLATVLLARDVRSGSGQMR
jgi:hypothetical protein